MSSIWICIQQHLRLAGPHLLVGLVAGELQRQAVASAVHAQDLAVQRSDLTVELLDLLLLVPRGRIGGR